MQTNGDKLPHVHVGIDPGVEGAIVMRCGPFVQAFRADGPAGYHPDADADADAIKAALLEGFSALRAAAYQHGLSAVIGRAVLEKASLRPDQGLASQARGMGNQRLIEGVLVGLGWPVTVLRAQRWRSIAGIKLGRWPDIKAATCDHVRTVLPGVELRPGRKRTDHDGIGDAAGMSIAAERLLHRELS